MTKEKHSSDHFDGATQKNYYEILGVSQDQNSDEIKSAFRALAKKHHPDLGGDPAIFRRIQEAYETLCDPEKRRTYDISITKKQSSSSVDEIREATEKLAQVREKIRMEEERFANIEKMIKERIKKL